MTAPRIAYVCCLWFGPREYHDPRASTDPLVYLKAQLASLSSLPHAIERVCFVVNDHGGIDCPNVETIVPERLGAATVTVLRRPSNAGTSYGAFDYGHAMLSAEGFDHYILAEDDYVFVAPHFDRILLDELERAGDDCGHMCCLIASDGHASLFSGIHRAAALDAMRRVHGKLTHPDSVSKVDICERGQRQWSFDLATAGWTTAACTARYRSAYWPTREQFGPPSAPLLNLPVPLLAEYGVAL